MESETIFNGTRNIPCSKGSEKQKVSDWKNSFRWDFKFHQFFSPFLNKNSREKFFPGKNRRKKSGKVKAHLIKNNHGARILQAIIFLNYCQPTFHVKTLHIFLLAQNERKKKFHNETFLRLPQLSSPDPPFCTQRLWYTLFFVSISLRNNNKSAMKANCEIIKYN